jgi:hypothetical protein
LNADTMMPPAFDAAPGDIAPQAPVAPPLWNPHAAACWSLLLTPAFGAWLQMQNWTALGEAEEAAAARRWCIGVLVLMIGLQLLQALAPSLRAGRLGNFIGLPLLLCWYYLSARPQARYVQERFGKQYPKRGWGKALGGAVLFMFAVIICASLIGAFAALFTGGAAAGGASHCGARCV